MALLLAPLWMGGCADVLFERSPYALRGLDIVYSTQEDMTFLVWRLRGQADPERVRFELWSDGDYRPIDLSTAPFPAEPYACDGDYLCFQYQLEGRVQWDEGVLPVRSIHEDEGIYGGSEPRVRLAEETFSVAPIAVEHNEVIDAQRYDWFEREGIPLKRGYEYQLVLSSEAYNRGDAAQVCAAASAQGWSGFDEEIAVDYAWVEEPRCLRARPARRDGAGGAEVIRLMPPSAELFSELQTYVPPSVAPPVIYLYLVDLLIRSQERCERAQREIMRTIDGQFDTRAPGSVRLGPFYPQDPQTGQTRDGCQQASAQDYPVTQVFDAARTAAARLEPERVRLVLVYMNNADLPPSPQVLEQLGELELRLKRIANIRLYKLAIASNALLGIDDALPGEPEEPDEGVGLRWDEKIGWRPIDDETFTDDMRSWASQALPFRTMDHDPSTQILIPAPQEARREPEAFKLCSASQQVLSVKLGEDGRTIAPGQRFYSWPQGDVPRYSVALAPQELVPNRKYKIQQATVVVEVCDRFCDMPFRAAGGQILSRWNGTSRCQWEGEEL